MHAGVDGDVNTILGIADLVIYGSFLEEQSFPSPLIRAMCLGKLIIAPDLAMIRNHVRFSDLICLSILEPSDPLLRYSLLTISFNHYQIDDGVNGYLFPKKNVAMITEILSQVISDGKLSFSAKNVGSIGKAQAENLLVSESVEGYAFLLEHIVKLPSEVAAPRTVADIPSRLKEEWLWYLFEDLADRNGRDRESRLDVVLDKMERQWNATYLESPFGTGGLIEEVFSPINWAEEKLIEMLNNRKRLEEEEVSVEIMLPSSSFHCIFIGVRNISCFISQWMAWLLLLQLKDRTDQAHGTWEEVYRNAKKADRARNEGHERDDKELERTGQPLCIYEPYFGEGTWPFLHHESLYRGIGLVSC